MINDEITDLTWSTVESDNPDFRLVRVSGYYCGVKCISFSYTNDELLADKVAIEAYLNRNLLQWARENYPPIDSLPTYVLT